MENTINTSISSWQNVHSSHRTESDSRFIQRRKMMDTSQVRKYRMVHVQKLFKWKR